MGIHKKMDRFFSSVFKLRYLFSNKRRYLSDSIPKECGSSLSVTFFYRLLQLVQEYLLKYLGMILVQISLWRILFVENISWTNTRILFEILSFSFTFSQLFLILLLSIINPTFTHLTLHCEVLYSDNITHKYTIDDIFVCFV